MAHSFVDDLIHRHAAGDRDPDLLNLLDRLAWSEFHDPWEAPPGCTDSPEEATLRMLRAYKPFAHLSDLELMEMLHENPMLPCEISIELWLQEMADVGNRHPAAVKRMGQKPGGRP